jgi:hypothetical protein
MIEFPHMSSGYRDALRVTERYLLPLVQRTTELARPASGTYTLVARFPEGNPYFGLYVRRLAGLRPHDVRFNIEFHENVHGSRQDVLISQNQLEVAAHDLSGFQTLVHRYLAVI